MVRRLLLLALLCGVAPAAVPSAAHGAWQRTDLPPATYDMASARPGEALVLHRTIEGTFATPFSGGAASGPEQQLDSGWTFYPVIDASLAGGAVAVWYNEDAGEIRVAERASTGGSFVRTAAVSGGPSNYSYGQPYVDVNERGDAMVAYLAETVGGLQEVRTIFRPAGGTFGPPEAVGGPAPWDTVYPRDVALGLDGTAVVSVVRSGQVRVAVRPPSGPWGAEEALGAPQSLKTWLRPQVGIDAAGDVVAAWLQTSGDRTDHGQVRVALRRAGETGFGRPIHTGLEASDLGRIHLGVSAPGEVILLVEASTPNEGGGWRLEGLHAAMGNALVGRLGQPARLNDDWGNYPSFAMNVRGDALVVYDDCCPLTVRAQRRLPLLGFGPPEDVQQPIELTGVRGGITVSGADVDVLGNARTTYHDGELEETYLAEALPLITEEPPAVPDLGDLIAPVIALLPEPPPLPDPPLPDPPLPDPPAPFGSLAHARAFAPPAPEASARSDARHTPDTAAPRVDLTVAPTLTRRRLITNVGCSEACSVRLLGTYAGRRLRPLELVLRRAGTRRVGIAVRRRAGARAKLVAVASDAAGNVTRRRVTVRVR